MHTAGHLLSNFKKKERNLTLYIAKLKQPIACVFSRGTVTSPQVNSTVCHTWFVLNTLGWGIISMLGHWLYPKEK